jgi:Putative collagen-binding domain of a collagenase
MPTACAAGWFEIYFLARESRMSRTIRRQATLAAALLALLVLVAVPIVGSPAADGKQAAAKPVGAAKGPLRVHPKNPRYFTDGTGRAVYLTGSHTWNTLQDWGTNDAIQPLDFRAFVKMLVAHHHNFTLLWTTELPTFRRLPTTASSPPDFSVTPHPWQRTGPGKGSDGKLKFDLTKHDQAYFDRLRDRVQRLHAAGVYAGVYLFSGEWLLRFRFAGDGYPFTGSDNVNGIDDGGGTSSVTMIAPNAITAIQDAYVKRVIDTLNDLPNVLWIVSQESPRNSSWWNSHLIALTRSYEAGKPLRHPIGYGVPADNNDATIINSNADWIAPAARIFPISSCASGRSRCQVVINDSDHSYFGMWNDSPQVNRRFFWINFTNGHQTLFMDPYVVYYPREKRNLCPFPVNGIGSGPDTRWDNVRDTMGYIRRYADRMDLAATVPHPELASTKHCLTQPGHEYLLYLPDGGATTVDLAAAPGTFLVEWMNPSDGKTSTVEAITGGAKRTLKAPFNGDAVLYLKK